MPVRFHGRLGINKLITKRSVSINLLEGIIHELVQSAIPRDNTPSKKPFHAECTEFDE